MTAAQYESEMKRLSLALDHADYIDSFDHMQREKREIRAEMNRLWITSAPPMPGMTYEGNERQWR